MSLEEQLQRIKDHGLIEQATEVSAMDVYRDMFFLGDGKIQCKYERGIIDGGDSYKANPIGYYKNEGEKHGHYRVFFEDTFEETLAELQAADFSILNGLTYFGRKNLSEHASKMYAMIFDIDGVSDKRLWELFAAARLDDLDENGHARDLFPRPQYLIFSGSGLHLYYLFDKPIPLFPYTKLQLKELKYAITTRLWHFASDLEKCQHQGINQGFRVVGGKTKQGSPREVVTAYRINSKRVTLEEMNSIVPNPDYHVDPRKIFKETKMTLAAAKEKYPEWYDRVVVGGAKWPKKWDIAGKVHGDEPWALYYWWLRLISENFTLHHRYFCIMGLVIYGVKCDVPDYVIRRDAEALLPAFNERYPDEAFTERDIDSAMECYDERYSFFPIKDIEKISAIDIERNARNYQKQAWHLEDARDTKRKMKQRGQPFKNAEGRPVGATRSIQVFEWRKKHRTGTTKDCAIETKLPRNTVARWWKEENQSSAVRVKVWRESNPNGCKAECVKALDLTWPTVRRWWGETLPVGRPDKRTLVQDWRRAHPDGKKSDCIKDLGIDKKTVYRWWSIESFDTKKSGEV